MQYYYPILESSTSIPQFHRAANLAFENQFKKIIAAYNGIGGFSAFYNDLKNKGIPRNLHADFLVLLRKIKTTITAMPMKYIGRSISNEYYSIFKVETENEKRKSKDIDVSYLIHTSGSFSIPQDYYEAFKVLGSFIGGQDSIVFEWAEFSVNASGKNLSFASVITEVLKSPITARDVAESKRIYKSILKKEGKVFCVWTGKQITSYDVDHLIPFSVWKNNDLWNLLPSQANTNNHKRDKIPSTDAIEKSKDLILHYCELINENQSQRFQKKYKWRFWEIIHFLPGKKQPLHSFKGVATI